MLSELERREVARIAETVALRAARETVHNSTIGGVLVQPALRPATVAETASPGADVTLRLDGDLGTLTRAAQNITGISVEASQRVMVLLMPNQAAFVIGSIGPAMAWTVLERIGPLAQADILAFNDIDQTGSELQIRAQLRSPLAAASDSCFLRINGDAAANYFDSIVFQSAATAVGANRTNRSGGYYAGSIQAASSGASRFAPTVITLPGYIREDAYKQGTLTSGFEALQVAVADTFWSDLAPVTDLQLRNSSATPTLWEVGSYAELLLLG